MRKSQPQGLLLLALVLLVVAAVVSALDSAKLQHAGTARVVDPLKIKKIHLIQMNHLDVGFTDTALNVVNLYFNKYFPQEIITANELKERGHKTGGEERLVYTTHAWLVSLYLDCPWTVWKGLHCPSEADRTSFINAIKVRVCWLEQCSFFVHFYWQVFIVAYYVFCL